MSWYSMAPELNFSRIVASPLYGNRKLTDSVRAITWSSSGPVEAPVSTLTRNGLPLSRSSTARFASAMGTAFGYPAPVKPDMPRTAPFGMRAAAASADITLDLSPLWRIRSDIAISLLDCVSSCHGRNGYDSGARFCDWCCAESGQINAGEGR